jgi:hypothetical protein
MVIYPYRHYSSWVFNDAAVGLEREPFVSGIPEMIDQQVAGIPDAEKGFKMLFSASPFPDYQVELEWVREDYGGNWYRETVSGQQGWLCPALFHYFDQAPAKIFIKAEPK